ncbi:LLM class flavin-dependent oxidoreductase [Nonomuraea soli]|uniref:Alkanesulfonate monooxygenase SsuD/methylene tetrahydromethanopterin reductase-like flavin-dependent oxidoreductase (Luciferase family) n=1 Tax=Nonomuraea soli TaxID=1032476 RepID=A0A7W0HNT3_9ACTN|nr:LLM class flavin-dependent oxidoreductase [Nonomuraea soli]MBA2890123.1 alkanesulfonate monooxygenase SsuD/methylene tetrahydromethanopterin reductase-like flavin-dependent oxidoreductase (luciferase family) [Nonomuraea soli]
MASLLDSANRLRLAVFSPNMAGGANLTFSADAPKATWAESVRLARTAEAAGIEAVIPVARWRGMAAAERREAHRSFEPFTWAAGIAAATSTIQVFATFHLPLVHPVAAAKQIATVDHISGGRFAVNLVAGWNSDEFQMFGHDLREHDDRYAVAEEWITLLNRIWAAGEEFDFDGRHFRGRNILSEPKPLNRTVIMNAGFSPAGQDFAARHADITFAMLPSVEAAADLVAPIKKRKPDLLVFAAAHIVCAESDELAREQYERMVGELGDRQAAERAIRLLIGSSRSGDFDGLAHAAIAGFFALPLVGSPGTVVARMKELAEAGVDGLALSWLDYDAGLAQYADTLRPLLVESGLREH